MFQKCYTLCINCINCVENKNKMKCSLGNFDVKVTDGLLFCSLDFECCDFERKRKNIIND